MGGVHMWTECPHGVLYRDGQENECDLCEQNTQIAALKAEVERLKPQEPIFTCDRCQEKVNRLFGCGSSKETLCASCISMAYWKMRARSQAWKKAAQQWRKVAWYFIYCRSPFSEPPDSIKSARWIISQLHPTTEGKSTQMKQTGSIEPKTKV